MSPRMNENGGNFQAKIRNQKSGVVESEKTSLEKQNKILIRMHLSICWMKPLFKIMKALTYFAKFAVDCITRLFFSFLHILLLKKAKNISENLSTHVYRVSQWQLYFSKAHCFYKNYPISKISSLRSRQWIVFYLGIIYGKITWSAKRLKLHKMMGWIFFLIYKQNQHVG